MNIHFQDLIPAEFDEASKVWIYQANRPFQLPEVLQIEELLDDFTSRWQSHGAEVKGYAKVFFGQFIVLMADERATGVSGCSTDGSVRLIKNIEQDFQVELFNRELLAFIVNERIQLLPLQELDSAIEDNIVTPDTLYFNNTILTKKELLDHWIIPVKESWLKKKVIANLKNEKA